MLDRGRRMRTGESVGERGRRGEHGSEQVDFRGKNGPGYAPGNLGPAILTFHVHSLGLAGLERTDGQDHRYAAAIVDVLFVDPQKISFLELNRDEDVCGGGDSKDQVRRRNDWSRPEDKQPSDI